MLQLCTPSLPLLCWRHIPYCPTVVPVCVRLAGCTTPPLGLPHRGRPACSLRPYTTPAPVPLAQPITNSTLRQAQGYSAAQCPSPALRPARYATRLCHRAPLWGMQDGVSAAIFALAPHLLAPPQKGRTPADANQESSRSLASLSTAAFASASG
ncbi:hypothetical protein B0H14DRAFT_1623987 [Mycena olivaceomarginata]|nr:hypothetical protein B0H14DRAFT_1623987 [Mycena olivaceomarginata]